MANYVKSEIILARLVGLHLCQRRGGFASNKMRSTPSP